MVWNLVTHKGVYLDGSTPHLLFRHLHDELMVEIERKREAENSG